jgi:hypothetical protein
MAMTQTEPQPPLRLVVTPETGIPVAPVAHRCLVTGERGHQPENRAWRDVLCEKRDGRLIGRNPLDLPLDQLAASGHPAATCAEVMVRLRIMHRVDRGEARGDGFLGLDPAEMPRRLTAIRRTICEACSPGSDSDVRRRSAVSPEECEGAFTLIVWGLFKKACLADNLGLIVTQTGLAVQHPNGGGLGYVYMYAFAAQIYCDFSAYTDIARGLAKLFGIELTRNFLTPYLSHSPSDFWQRWHISLSRWLRDYLYIPLGGNQHGRLKTLRNLAITMFLGGLWHGAGFGFIIWGLYHGLLLILYRLLPIDQMLRERLGRAGTILAIVIMFQLVCIGWIFFRATSAEIWPLLSSLVDMPSIAEHGVLLWGLTLFGLPLVVTELIAYCRGVEFVDVLDRLSWQARAILYVALFYAMVFFAARSQNEFIYFQF